MHRLLIRTALPRVGANALSFSGARLRGSRPTRPAWAAAARYLSTQPPSSGNDPYATLGLARDATQEQVKAAYYKLALEMHPDRNDAPDAVDKFAQIGAAYSAIMGAPELNPRRAESADSANVVKQAPFARAYAPVVYKWMEYLLRVPQRLDMWLMPSWSSTIYQHLRKNELGEAIATFEEMRLAGERPSNAVYEMLIRGCTIAMQRTPVGTVPDHLTINLVQKVLELWGDMEAVGQKPDYLTYIELLRAFGKGGQLPQATMIFEHMCSKVTLLPEERAFNSMYEVCVRAGAYKEALEVFDEQEEMRKSLWKPRFTPVSFSLLLTAAAAESARNAGAIGDDHAQRLDHLPRVLNQMASYGVLPRVETCENLLTACLKHAHLERGPTGDDVVAGFVGGTHLDTARQVIAVAERAGHELSPALLEEFERAENLLASSASPGVAASEASARGKLGDGRGDKGDAGSDTRAGGERGGSSGGGDRAGQGKSGS
jgi:tetratricopeptide (TPR) repeat protein